MQSTIPNIPKHTSDMISLVTDPYHDYNLRATGFPDGKAVASAVQRNSNRVDISCPFSIAADQSWDFHVFATPLIGVNGLNPGVLSANSTLITVNTAAAQQAFGPVNILYKHYNNAGTVINTLLVALDGLSNADTQARTVSLGFELHNTTAELYKSGALTVYRSPVLVNEDIDMNLVTTGTVTAGWYHATYLGQLPYTLTDVQRIPNSRTWEAAEGAYCVALPYYENAFSSNLAQNIAIKAGVLADSILIKRALATSSVASAQFSPLSCPGVMSSRFKDKEQTFTLDMRQVIELVPTSDNSTIMAFATNAPEVDRVFLKIYKRMFNNIPPGVPVKFNSAGDWFRMIARIVKEQLPTLTNLLPPNVRAVATVATPIINKLLDKAIASKQTEPVLNTTQRVIKPALIQRALVRKRKRTKGQKRPT